jgi:hypothetical protein
MNSMAQFRLCISRAVWSKSMLVADAWWLLFVHQTLFVPVQTLFSYFCQFFFICCVIIFKVQKHSCQFRWSSIRVTTLLKNTGIFRAIVITRSSALSAPSSATACKNLFVSHNFAIYYRKWQELSNGEYFIVRDLHDDLQKKTSVGALRLLFHPKNYFFKVTTISPLQLKHLI